MPLIRTEKLGHTYSAGTPFEHVAIHDIDFTAERGECIGIIGHTGSGKSTFIQHLNGLLRPTSGTVYVDDEDIGASKTALLGVRFKVGLVFQYPEYQLFETTVYKDIAFGPGNMGLSESEIHERVVEAAEFASLPEELLGKSPFELSGGQKRRAAIAGVIAMRPRVLILDEPTAGLDPGGRDEIMDNIMRYKHAYNATVIMITHSMEEIARIVQRIVLFENGRVVMEGTPERVFSEGDRLRALGLNAPKAAQVAQRLRALGLQIPPGIYTPEQLTGAILQLKGGSGNA